MSTQDGNQVFRSLNDVRRSYLPIASERDAQLERVQLGEHTDGPRQPWPQLAEFLRIALRRQDS